MPSSSSSESSDAPASPVAAAPAVAIEAEQSALDVAVRVAPAGSSSASGTQSPRSGEWTRTHFDRRNRLATEVAPGDVEPLDDAVLDQQALLSNEDFRKPAVTLGARFKHQLVKQLPRYFPPISWVPKYNLLKLRGDIIAGLTVGVLLIPQGMSYALVAGMPVQYGLYSSIVPLIIYALFGTCGQLSVAPVAITSLLVNAAATELTHNNNRAEYIQIAITLSLLVGIIQLGLGLLRMGFLVNFLSHPVISGFSAAAAIEIALSQMKHVWGVSLPRREAAYLEIYDVLVAIPRIRWVPLVFALGTIALIIVMKRIHASIPSALIVVVISIAISWPLGLYEMANLTVIGFVPSGLPMPGLYFLPTDRWVELLPDAFAIAGISLLESIAIGIKLSTQAGDTIVPNQELTAIGLAQIVGSFFQSFPTSGGFSRSVVNATAGAKTTLSSLISAIVVGIMVALLTFLVFHLPNATLAGIIIVAVANLIDVGEAIHLWKTDKRDLFLMLVSFIATIFLGVEIGVLIGVAMSIVVVLFRMSRPHFAVMGRLGKTAEFRNVKRYENATTFKGVGIVRLDASIYFGNTQYVRDMFRKLEKHEARHGRELHAIVFDCVAVNDIDSSGLTAMRDIIVTLHKAKRRMFFARVKGPVRDELVKGEITKVLGDGAMHVALLDAVQAAVRYARDCEAGVALLPPGAPSASGAAGGPAAPACVRLRRHLFAQFCCCVSWRCPACSRGGRCGRRGAAAPPDGTRGPVAAASAAGAEGGDVELQAVPDDSRV